MSNKSFKFSKLFQTGENEKDSFSNIKDSIKRKETLEDSANAVNETSKLEKAISALASNLNVKISDDLLLQIKQEDIQNKKLKSHLSKLEIIEHKMEDHMQTIQSNIENIQNALSNDSGSSDKEMKFRDEFKEWQETQSKEGSIEIIGYNIIDIDYFEELSQYTTFLKMKINEHNKKIKQINQDVENNQLANEGDKDQVSNTIEVYKEQKESLEVLSKKLISKFQEVVDNAEKSFIKLKSSIKKYEDKLNTKKQELTENSSMYYNLKNISDNSISEDIQKRIQEHLKFLESTGRNIRYNKNRTSEKGNNCKRGKRIR